MFYDTPVETPIEDLEVIEEENVVPETKTDEVPLEQDSNIEKPNAIIDNTDDDKPDPETDNEGQTLLF